MIDLYTATTPNGRKVSIALEDMALAYGVNAINLKALDRKARFGSSRAPRSRRRSR